MPFIAPPYEGSLYGIFQLELTVNPSHIARSDVQLAFAAHYDLTAFVKEGKRFELIPNALKEFIKYNGEFNRSAYIASLYASRLAGDPISLEEIKRKLAQYEYSAEDIAEVENAVVACAELKWKTPAEIFLAWARQFGGNYAYDADAWDKFLEVNHAQRVYDAVSEMEMVIAARDLCGKSVIG